MDIAVDRVQMDIIELLDKANRFADEIGISRETVAQASKAS